MIGGKVKSGAEHNPTGKFYDDLCFLSYSSVSWRLYLVAWI